MGTTAAISRLLHLPFLLSRILTHCTDAEPLLGHIRRRERGQLLQRHGHVGHEDDGMEQPSDHRHSSNAKSRYLSHPQCVVLGGT